MREGTEFLNLSYTDGSKTYVQRYNLDAEPYLSNDRELFNNSGNPIRLINSGNGDPYLMEAISFNFGQASATASNIREINFTHNITSTIDSALIKLNEDRASLGSLSNRLDNIMAVNMNTSIGLSKANGLIEDTNYAQETADLAKNQILQQASIQMQVLRNRSGDNILELLSSRSFFISL